MKPVGNPSRFVLYLAMLMLLTPALFAREEGSLTPALVNPGYVEKPAWFKVSFLDLYEDIDEAKAEGKRLMLYFYQDGCPYCKKLLEDNFGQRDIATLTQKYFDVVAINIWGDKDVTVGDRVFSEKQFAEALKVQYTPTLLFFNEKRKAVFRANGYYPPERFRVVLEYVGRHLEEKESFQQALARMAPPPSSGRLHVEHGTVKNPENLQQALSPDKPLLVMFEQRQCSTCDELHDDILQRPESRKLLDRFNVAVLDMWSQQPVVTPSGKRLRIRDWAKQADIQYAPSLLFFDASGKEIFRIDAYLKAFHVQSVMDYVASGAYTRWPNFQRYIEDRAERLRARGIEVELMK